jgi:hypothetical protein
LSAFSTQLGIGIDAAAFLAEIRLTIPTSAHGILAELVSAICTLDIVRQGGIRALHIGASTQTAGIARIVASDAHNLVAELAFQFIGAGVAHWNSALDAMVGAIRAFLAHHGVLFLLTETSRHLATFPVDSVFALAALDGRILGVDFIVAYSARKSRFLCQWDGIHGFDGETEYGGHHLEI